MGREDATISATSALALLHTYLIFFTKIHLNAQKQRAKTPYQKDSKTRYYISKVVVLKQFQHIFIDISIKTQTVCFYNSIPFFSFSEKH